LRERERVEKERESRSREKGLKYRENMGQEREG
jgi:hypothetical protein